MSSVSEETVGEKLSDNATTDEELSGGSDDGTDDETHHVDPNVDAKKKKKKKKKKSKSGGQQPQQHAEQTSPSKSEKAESEKRFANALEAVKGGADMWLDLQNSHLHDAKTKKLFESLKGNTSITSVNLAQNHISDEGAQAIAAILGMQGAPELIEVDLRENPFSDRGLAILDGLKKIRKQLEIRTGSIAPPKPVTPAETSPKEKTDFTKGPMFKKYFQHGSDDDDATSGADEGASMQSPRANPEELWTKVEQCLQEGRGGIPAMSVALQAISKGLSDALSVLKHQPSGLCRELTTAVGHLSTLSEVLQLHPVTVITQFSNQPQSAVGSHRIWAADVTLQIVSFSARPAYLQSVAASKHISRILHLALSHPHTSALHARAVAILGTCLSASVKELWLPLFSDGFGADCCEQGADAPCPPLQQLLATMVSAQADRRSGVRSAHTGFLLQLCQVLQGATQLGGSTANELKALLEKDSQWSSFAAPGGTLATMLKEQEGDLGGPRAERTPQGDDMDLADFAGGGMISGREIMALLQGIGSPLS